MIAPQEDSSDRTENTEVSILVPVFNEEAHLEDSVASMAEQQDVERLEILLVDGGSTDDTPQILERLSAADPRVRVLRNPRRVIPSGLNVGLRAARGRYVVRMDAHTRYPPDYVRRGVERLRRGGTGWVSGPQVPRGDSPVGCATALVLASVWGRGGSGRWAVSGNEAEYQLDTGVFCGVWERSVLLEYGGWDERWERNEDSELAGRFIARGERLVCCREMAAEYRPRDSLRALVRQYWANGRFRAKTTLRQPSSLRVTTLLPVGVAASAVLAAAGPPPLRGLGRAGIGIYAVAVTAATFHLWPRADTSQEALIVPPVIVGMHLAFGLGFLVGLLGELRGGSINDPRSVRQTREVYAPSLSRERVPRVAGA